VTKSGAAFCFYTPTGPQKLRWVSEISLTFPENFDWTQPKKPIGHGEPQIWSPGKVKEISKPITTFEVPKGYKEKYSGHS
jgi:hypothetical protein